MNAFQRRWIVKGAAVLGLLLLAASAASAQAKGQPRLNVYFPTGLNDPTWQRETLDRVLKAWIVAETPPALDKKTVVLVTIERDGKVKDAKISTSSGSEEWDKTALETVKKAAPFPALPKAWTPPTAEVHFHYEYVKA